MRFRRRKPAPRRPSLVELDAIERNLRFITQGHDRFNVITVGPGSLEGPDGLWVGKWLWSGERLTGIVKAIKENTRPLPPGIPAGPNQVWPEGADWHGSVPRQKVYRVFIERPWEYADLPRQHLPVPRPKIREGLTPRSMYG